jgi:hypothetical protein
LELVSRVQFDRLVEIGESVGEAADAGPDVRPPRERLRVRRRQVREAAQHRDLVAVKPPELFCPAHPHELPVVLNECAAKLGGDQQVARAVPFFGHDPLEQGHRFRRPALLDQ